MEVFIGTILAFGFNFAPKGWLPCDGRLLQVNQYTALYALLGGTYGGNGQTNFALPDLRGRSVISAGQFGSTNFVLGQAAGTETVTLVGTNLPPHTHTLFAQNGAGSSSTPGGNLLANAAGTDQGDNPVSVTVYAPRTAATPMDPQAIGLTGSSLPVPIRNPYLACTVCIAVEGIYPSRP